MRLFNVLVSFENEYKKHKNPIPALNDINALHMRDSETTYNLLLKLILRRWTKDR